MEGKIVVYLKNGSQVTLPGCDYRDFNSFAKQMSNWKEGIIYGSRIWISKKEIVSFEHVKTI